MDLKKIKNILIIGPTKVGKSALCNVLSDTRGFEENESTAKETKNFQEKIFEHDWMKYHVVEIGIKSIEKKDLYNKIGKVINFMPEGLSQILFVVNERIMAEDIDTFYLSKDFIFKCGILDYVTIVKIKFSDFKSPKKREEDYKELCNENEKISKIFKSCKKIIYVNNPPINIITENGDVDKERVEIHEKIRKKSRIILLDPMKERNKEQQTKGLKKDQQWFNEEYNKEKVINIDGKQLDFGGSLEIKGFSNLENISLKKLKINSLKISNYSQLNIINLSELSKLKSLSVAKTNHA
ncbi:hypothetical protein RclHR1_04540004 [Rhizophagus clarus]|uniref:AIG1-type G domain-containing protein n=1 Tax=Rhizophagus clarus TaxID=94130 RepID=A0A2Z6RZJ0_9GLOM|nr:hypothetical protein RclHR1_04540004 [Rhizophagus clarus]